MTYVTLWDGTRNTSRYLHHEDVPPRQGTLSDAVAGGERKRELLQRAWVAWEKPLTLAEVAERLEIDGDEMNTLFQCWRAKLTNVGRAPLDRRKQRRLVHLFQQAALVDTVAARVGA